MPMITEWLVGVIQRFDDLYLALALERGRSLLGLTSRQTNASSGEVVNMLRPKHSRATLMSVSVYGE